MAQIGELELDEIKPKTKLVRTKSFTFREDMDSIVGDSQARNSTVVNTGTNLASGQSDCFKPVVSKLGGNSIGDK